MGPAAKDKAKGSGWKKGTLLEALPLASGLTSGSIDKFLNLLGGAKVPIDKGKVRQCLDSGLLAELLACIDPKLLSLSLSAKGKKLDAKNDMLYSTLDALLTAKDVSAKREKAALCDLCFKHVHTLVKIAVEVSLHVEARELAADLLIAIFKNGNREAHKHDFFHGDRKAASKLLLRDVTALLVGSTTFGLQLRLLDLLCALGSRSEPMRDAALGSFLGEGLQLQNGPDFEATATSALAAFNRAHGTRVVSLPVTNLVSFDAPLATQPGAEGWLHFGQDLVSVMSTCSTLRFGYDKLRAVTLEDADASAVADQGLSDDEQSHDVGSTGRCLRLTLEVDPAKMPDHFGPGGGTGSSNCTIQGTVSTEAADELRTRCLARLPTGVCINDAQRPHQSALEVTQVDEDDDGLGQGDGQDAGPPAVSHKAAACASHREGATPAGPLRALSASRQNARRQAVEEPASAIVPSMLQRSSGKGRAPAAGEGIPSSSKTSPRRAAPEQDGVAEFKQRNGDGVEAGSNALRDSSCGSRSKLVRDEQDDSQDDAALPTTARCAQAVVAPSVEARSRLSDLAAAHHADKGRVRRGAGEQGECAPASAAHSMPPSDEEMSEAEEAEEVAEALPSKDAADGRAENVWAAEESQAAVVGDDEFGGDKSDGDQPLSASEQSEVVVFGPRSAAPRQSLRETSSSQGESQSSGNSCHAGRGESGAKTTTAATKAVGGQAAFTLYVRHVRESMQTASYAEARTIASAEWKQMSAEQKAKWQVPQVECTAAEGSRLGDGDVAARSAKPAPAKSRPVRTAPSSKKTETQALPGFSHGAISSPEGARSGNGCVAQGSARPAAAKSRPAGTASSKRRAAQALPDVSDDAISSPEGARSGYGCVAQRSARPAAAKSLPLGTASSNNAETRALPELSDEGISSPEGSRSGNGCAASRSARPAAAKSRPAGTAASRKKAETQALPELSDDTSSSEDFDMEQTTRDAEGGDEDEEDELGIAAGMDAGSKQHNHKVAAESDFAVPPRDKKRKAVGGDVDTQHRPQGASNTTGRACINTAFGTCLEGTLRSAFADHTLSPTHSEIISSMAEAEASYSLRAGLQAQSAMRRPTQTPNPRFNVGALYNAHLSPGQARQLQEVDALLDKLQKVSAAAREVGCQSVISKGVRHVEEALAAVNAAVEEQLGTVPPSQSQSLQKTYVQLTKKLAQLHASQAEREQERQFRIERLQAAARSIRKEYKGLAEKCNSKLQEATDRLKQSRVNLEEAQRKKARHETEERGRLNRDLAALMSVLG